MSPTALAGSALPVARQTMVTGGCSADASIHGRRPTDAWTKGATSWSYARSSADTIGPQYGAEAICLANGSRAGASSSSTRAGAGRR